MTKGELFKRAAELNFPDGQYAIFGSAPICARDLRECNDIDIIVKEPLFEDLKKQGGWELKLKKDGTEYLVKENVEIFKNWAPGEWNVEELIKNADAIGGLPFVRLQDVMRWKKMMGREKDSADIVLMENFLKK
jgi:hypothetical protein